MVDLLQRGDNETSRLIERELRCGWWSLEFQTNEMKWSRGYYDLLGLEAADVTPSFAAMLQVTHPEDRQLQAEVELIIREASTIRRKFRIIRPGGKIVWIYCQIIVLVSPKGASEKAVGICTDVTDLEDRLKPLRSADERYRALVRASGGVVWIAKADGRVHEILNWAGAKDAPESALDSGWIELIHPDDQERTINAWDDARLQKRGFEILHRFRQSDGSYRWRRTQAEPILDDKGNVKEWLGINLDAEQRTANASRPQLNRITGAQMRAARGLLRWSVMDLANAAGVSRATIRRLEEVDGPAPHHEPALMLIQAAILGAGVELFFPEAGKPGIRPR